VRHVYTPPLQALAQLVALPVIADGADRMDAGDLQGRQIGRDRSRRAGAVADADDLEGVQPRLQRGLVQRRVNDEVLVEKEVAADGDANGGEGIQYLEEAVGGHHGWESFTGWTG